MAAGLIDLKLRESFQSESMVEPLVGYGTPVQPFRNFSDENSSRGYLAIAPIVYKWWCSEDEWILGNLPRVSCKF